MATVSSRDHFMPDFCSAQGALPVMLIAELVAVVLALAGLGGAQGFWHGLFYLSVYVQWIGVCSAGVLCMIRRRSGPHPSWRIAAVSYAGLLLVTLALAEVAYSAGRFTAIAPLVAETGHVEFLWRNLGISAVVAVLGLRYFWLRSDWLRQAEAEGNARYEALQARIRPHFLFNTLNGITELVATRPEVAERALEDLSALLRAALAEGDRRLMPLAEELELSRAYVDIETLRLGDRLEVSWDVAPAAERWPVPPLSVQPLVENAIYHGIGGLSAGGRVEVRGAVEGDRLVVTVRNPVPSVPAASGQRLALDNIRQRLALRYGESAELRQSADDGMFEVELRLPRAPGDAP